ncbi:diguanylate cyclase [Billgrantia gudaonensis]|uniref:diguanylate cyclase n=1 Tax=Billgrantia gudaonensis TaxID=376427 RepID=A0A432JKL4_9GAMM|nr:diguanylate cyclase [Halomonas gudaonensis]
MARPHQPAAARAPEPARRTGPAARHELHRWAHGLSNRRYLDEYLAVAAKAAVTDGKPLSLVMLDLDRFKAFNDRWGIGGRPWPAAPGKVMCDAVRRG